MLLRLRNQKRVCPPAHKPLLQPWSSSRVEQRYVLTLYLSDACLHFHPQTLFILCFYDCVLYIYIVASGGPSPDCGVDFWDGGEKQSGRLWRWSWTHRPQFSLCLSANISQTAVPVRMFWPWCCQQWGAKRGKCPTAPLPGNCYMDLILDLFQRY